jgi:lipoic acid synthetase
MSRRLNVLPENPEKSPSLGRFPSWLHRKLPSGPALLETESKLKSERLPTVCEEARCPNRWECWSKKTATFLAMGKECTRSCAFCSIHFSKTPAPPEKDEPERIARSVEALNLRHAVLTMVARDDLPDGGALHLKAIIDAIRKRCPGSTIETLTSDFAGNKEAWETLLMSRPEVFNYNIETVRALTPQIRHRATYDRTLELLSFLRKGTKKGSGWIKSGIMLGFGESREQVLETLGDLQAVGCDIVTIGQYLQPSKQKTRVKTFIPPELFDDFAQEGKKIGIPYVYAGPFVRSSYNADLVFKEASIG